MHLQFIFQTLYQRPFPTCLAGNHQALGKTRARALASTWAGECPGAALTGSSLMLSMKIQNTRSLCPAAPFWIASTRGKARPPILLQSCDHSRSEQRPRLREWALLQPRRLQYSVGGVLRRRGVLRRQGVLRRRGVLRQLGVLRRLGGF